MNGRERRQVREALEGRDADRIEAISALATAEQVHQFMLNYNVNDGVLPALAIARHPVCDAGTALYLYWQFGDCLFAPEFRDESRTKAPDWNVAVVLDELEKRFTLNDFKTADIFYDPQEHSQLNVIQKRQLTAAGVSADRFKPVGRIRLEPEWVFDT